MQGIQRISPWKYATSLGRPSVFGFASLGSVYSNIVLVNLKSPDKLSLDQDRREDTMLQLAHFRRHKRKAVKKTPGKTSNYPFQKPEENHPPGKDSSKKISNLIGKAANFANTAKTKKVKFYSSLDVSFQVYKNVP